MSPTSKKIVGGVIALLFIVTIVQSAAIAKVAKGLRSNAQNVATLSNTESQSAAVSKTESAAKRADGTNGVYADALKGDKVTNKEITILCTPAGCDNGVTLPYTFQFDDSVNITYCGGGGGGGGGGRGHDVHATLFGETIGPIDEGYGFGGGGGGGGAAGQCHSYAEVKIKPGQTINSNIGVGGVGGVGGFLRSVYDISPVAGINPVLAIIFGAFHALPDYEELAFIDFDSITSNSPTNGGNGSVTTISFNGNGSAYPIANGGFGGFMGINGVLDLPGIGGVGGNTMLPNVWHDGVNGAGDYDDWGGEYGGQGGDGESLAGSISGVTTPSSGGGTAISDGATDISHNGVAGNLSYGGGGGSGGFGDYYEQFGCGNGPDVAQGTLPMMNNPAPDPFGLLPDQVPVPGGVPAPFDLYEDLCRILKGGNGGEGGDGYLKIEGVQIPPATQMVFETPGTHTFGWTMVPAGATVTVKVWGAGGGGGRAFENSFTTLEDIMGAGGGSGAYVVHQMINPGSGSMPVVVGSGGQNGVAGGPNAGSAGGQSSFGAVIATGGNGGSGDTEGNQNANVYGGSGGIATGGSVSNTNGVTGASGVAGGLGGDQTGLVGFADGGKGGIINNQGGVNLVNRNSEAGKPGRVEITW